MWQMIGSTYFEGAETPDGDNILVPMVKAIEELTRTCLVATFILYLYVLVLHTPNPDVPGAWTDCELVAAHSSPQMMMTRYAFFVSTTSHAAAAALKRTFIFS